MSAQDQKADEGWVAIARLLRPQGRRGEILAEPLTDLDGIFAAGQQVWLASGAGEKQAPAPGAEPRTVEGSWRPTGRNAGRVVLKLAGVDSIDAAEAVAPSSAFVPASAMPALDEDRYFVRDLLGAALWNGPELVGEIEDVEFAVGADGRTRLSEAAPLLVVRLAQRTPDVATQEELAAEDSASDEDVDETVLVPFVREWIAEVDLAGRRVVMHLPQGLVEEA